MQDIIIIGGGPAGLTAGLYAARAGARTLLLEASLTGGQAASTSRIENYPGFAEGVDGVELAMEMARQAENAGVVIQYGRVNALQLGEPVKRVETDDGALETKAIILAMGAQARRLEVPGEATLTGRGVSWCATCDGALYRGKRVAVIGGGNTAAEEALYLAALCESVTLIHRRDALRAEHALVERVLETPNIHVLWDSVVRAFEGQGKLQALRVAHVKTGEEHTLELDGAFVAVGKLPDTGLVAGQLALDAEGYILAGEDTRTSLAGVYAAGDLRAKPLRQVVTAAADGAVAASVALRDLREA